MYLRNVLWEPEATENQVIDKGEVDAMATSLLVVPSPTLPARAATATEIEVESAMTPVVVPILPAEQAAPAATIIIPDDVLLMPYTTLAPDMEAGAAATTPTMPTVPVNSEEMERGFAQPSPSSSSSSASSPSRIPKYHAQQQQPVKPQHMFRDSIVFAKPPTMEGTKLGSISEDEDNGREEEEGLVMPVVVGVEEEEEKREEGKEEREGQSMVEGGVVGLSGEGLVVLKEHENEEEEEEEGACLTTCCYLSPLSMQADTDAEEEEAVHNGENTPQGVPMMTMTVALDEVEEGVKEEGEQENGGAPAIGEDALESEL